MWQVRIANADQARRLGEKLGEMTKEQALLVRVEAWHRPKSYPQLAKVHSMIDEFASLTGYHSEELKEILKQDFGVREIVTDLQGAERQLLKSFRDYTREEMAEFIERVYMVAADAGFILQ